MKIKTKRFWAVISLLSILVYGVFKIPVLRLYASGLKRLIDLLNLPADGILSFLYKQGDHADMANYSLGWVIYYPTYLLLHLLFIHLLFYQQPNIKKVLSIGLTALVIMLVVLWFIFLQLGNPEIAGFFRNLFYKLFGLPFILLAIEGGRILYNDILSKID